ncbi:MAG: hypothetical protein FJX72_12005 [Armatimonadetes bacterium]|nr:hypothetical protein [Armatimonadota bacterium]
MVHAQLCQMPCFLILGCVVAALVSVSPVEAQLRLPSLLGDNAVLQRLVRVPIWGYGPPGATVRVTLAGQSCSAVVGADGTWRVRLDPMQAGGPYDMVVSAAAPTLPSPGTGEGRVGATSDQVVSRNVMVGDVWVASGQSNMVWPLNQSRNGDAETRAASFPQIRLFALLREPAAAPLMDCRGKWASCSPETAGGFSGVAYFFGRDLHARLGVPIGLIQSDVGGTPAESWTDPAWLRDDPDFAELLTKTPPAGAAAPLGQAAYEKTMNDWYVGAMMKDAGNRGFAQGWAGPSPPGEWGTMNLPGAWEANEPRLDIDGAVWYRHTVTIPRGWVGKGLTLSLGTIADRDVTYFGGVEVGASGGQYPDASVRRTYTVPARLVVEGPVVIAVRVFNMIAAGGFTGEPSDMRLHLTTDPASALSLAGPWRFRIEADRSAASVPPMPPPPADVWTAWSTGGLYNGMVAPLTRHAIRGVIWYQGESNVGRPDQYTTSCSPR